MKFCLLALAPLFLAGSASARVRGERKQEENPTDQFKRALQKTDPNVVTECWQVGQNQHEECDAMGILRLAQDPPLSGCLHLTDGHCVADPGPEPGERDGHCSVTLTTTVKGQKTYETYAEVDACNEGMGYVCFPQDTGAPLNSTAAMAGQCELELCNGKREPGIKDKDEDQSNEASWRMTICHRTCSATNPWVRITIDDDAWGSPDGLNGASGCGHSREHIVRDECQETIQRRADDDGVSFEEALVSIYGPNDRDYLLKDHGTRVELREKMGWTAPNCQNTGQGVKCNGYSDAEKEYWFEWERACPYVRNGACCGHPEGWNGPCCGGKPYPDAEITLKKYACTADATCIDSDIGPHCHDVTLQGPTGEAAKYCYKVTNGPVMPICNVTVTDPEIDTNFMSNLGCLAQDETKWAPDFLETVFPQPDISPEEETAVVIGMPSICDGGVMESTCEPPVGAYPVTDKDPAQLVGTPEPVPPQPFISLEKYSCTNDVETCDDTVLQGAKPKCVEDLEGRVGHDAKYCYKVKNIGEPELCDIALTDTDAGIGNVPMPVGCMVSEQEEWSSNPVPKQFPDTPLTTPATVCGSSPDGTEVCATDESTLRGYNPSIQIEKFSCNVHADGCSDASASNPEHCSPDILDTPMAGSDATYCYKITNIGTSTLCGIEMNDLISGLTTSVPGQSLAPSGAAWTEHSFSTTFPDPDTQVETWGNVTGLPCKADGTILDQTPVQDSDPSGLKSPPAPLPPLVPDVRIRKFSCFGNVACSDSIQALDTDPPTCVEMLLEGPEGDPAKYCYVVTNSGNETICGVTVTDPITEPVTTIDVSPAEMPDGCMLPGAVVALSQGLDRTFPEEEEGVLAKVVAQGQDTGIEVTHSDPASLIGTSRCPVDMGLSGTRANTEIGGSCSGTAVYLENSIPNPVEGLPSDFPIVDVFYAIESVTEERISFRVQNPFGTKHDMYVRYHKPMGTGDAMEKACVMEPEVDECAFLDSPIVAECINPADIDGNTSIQPYTVVDLYFVTIGQETPSHTDAQVDDCCLAADQAQPALTEDVIQLTFVLDCKCPSLYTGSVARAL